MTQPVKDRFWPCVAYVLVMTVVIMARVGCSHLAQKISPPPSTAASAAHSPS